LVLVFLGYTFSTLAISHMQAMWLTFFFFLSSLLLSGFIFPFRGIPAWAHILGEIITSTNFLRVFRAVMLKSADLRIIAGDTTALVLIVLVFAAFALLRFRGISD
jgi:ABC-2 type transport system permease protein